MKEITSVGLDLAKTAFHVHAVDAAGAVVVRRQLRRVHVLLFFSRQTPCLIGIEACAGAHFWARELAKFGHEVRLIPPSYVKPFVKRGKTDAADAEAICGGDPADDALRADQDRDPAGGTDAASDPGLSGPPADPARQRDPRPSGLVRPGCGKGRPQHEPPRR